MARVAATIDLIAEERQELEGLSQGRSWRIDEALYFTFVTGLTIGYGDFTPHHVTTRLLTVVIGFAGIVLTGLVAAVAVQALKAANIHLA